MSFDALSMPRTVLLPRSEGIKAITGWNRKLPISDELRGTVRHALTRSVPGIDEAEAHERDKGRLSDVTGHEKRAVGNPGTIKTDSAQQVPREDVESHPV